MPSKRQERRRQRERKARQAERKRRLRICGDVFRDAAERVRDGHHYDMATMKDELVTEMRQRMADEGARVAPRRIR